MSFEHLTPHDTWTAPWFLNISGISWKENLLNATLQIRISNDGTVTFSIKKLYESSEAFRKILIFLRFLCNWFETRKFKIFKKKLFKLKSSEFNKKFSILSNVLKPDECLHFTKAAAFPLCHFPSRFKNN